MPTVNIKNGQSFCCPTGSTLLDALLQAGAFMESPCGGKGSCGKCKVRVLCGGGELHATERQLLRPEEIADGLRLSCLLSVEEDMDVELLQQERRHEILTAGYRPDFCIDGEEGCGVALDIGTTTIAAALLDLRSGRELAQASDINPQKQYGLDVLSRISYEYEKGEEGIKQLQRVLLSCIDRLLQELCESAGIEKRELRRIVVAANCAMIHMLLGEDARPLGRAPYAPRFLNAQQCRACDLGLDCGADTQLICLPQVSAYIGGDIVAGASVCQLENSKDTVLFIDIGTNGEIILAHEGRLLSCSCAAGPALEGMNISCGMRAAEGAVEDIKIMDTVELTTIGAAPPAGLCGSGILAAVRELLKGGYVKKTGAFVPLDKAPQPPILRLNGTKREAVLCEKPELIVTQDDLRQVQLAKGAILSGFRVLLKEAGISMEQLDSVIIAGQFGAHLPVDSLIGIGLLPEQLRNKLSYVGNSSRTGAEMALLSAEKRREMEELATKIDYIELAQTADYERIFAESLSFQIN